MTAIQQVSNHPLIASDRIEGTLVRRHNGEKIGRIERLMIDKASGTIAYAVMSFGGLFGLGDNHYQIPWSLLKELCGNLGDAARSGGVVYRRFEDLDAVFESDTCNNLRQVICAFRPPPGF